MSEELIIDTKQPFVRPSRGGTELMVELLNTTLPASLLNKFQIIASRKRVVNPNKKTIFWAHDLPGDPEVEFLRDPEERAKLSKIIFVSYWQQQMYNMILGVPYSEGIVIQNGIIPIDISEKQESDKIRLIYTPTPHRGLDILVPVFKHLVEKHNNITLDVYSSFKLYGWDESDAQYKQLFDECREHPQINYRGTVSNEELRKALVNSDIFAYPSTWQETSCRCLMEAMSAGLLCVHSSLAALPETSGGLTYMYNFVEEKIHHANIFATVLDHAITHYQELKPNLMLQKVIADSRFNWAAQATRWQGLLTNLLQ